MIIEGRGKELEEFSAIICEQFPKLSSFETWTSYLQKLVDGFLLKNLDGQLAYAVSVSDQKVTAYVSPEITQREAEIEAALPEINFVNHRSMVKSWQKSFDLDWEVDVFLSELTAVYSKLQPGDKVEIQGILSEDRQVRAELKEKIQTELQARQVTGTVELVCAHKQGYSWIEEVILPKLKSQKIEKVTINFKPFYLKG